MIKKKPLFNNDKRADLKEFRIQKIFCLETDLYNIMQPILGAVKPFCVLNDKNCKITFFLDKEFLDATVIIGVHPNDNTVTVWLKTEKFPNKISKYLEYQIHKLTSWMEKDLFLHLLGKHLSILF